MLMDTSLSPQLAVQQALVSQWRETGPRVFLFAGPDGVGRRATAEWFARYLNCSTPGSQPCGTCESCRIFTAGQHPDFTVLHPVRGRGEFTRIGIEQLVPREGNDNEPLATWLEHAPLHQWRVAVIHQAHTMTHAAANAFLKRFEEPPRRTVIILVAPDAHQLLPTVASRVVPFRFTAVPVEAPIAGHPAVHLGQPGLLASLQQPETAELVTAVANATQAFIDGIHDDFAVVLERATELQKAHQAAITAEATSAIPWLLEHTRELPPGAHAKAHAAIYELHEQLTLHANPALTFMHLATVLRTIL